VFSQTEDIKSDNPFQKVGGGGEQSCPVGLDAFACPPNINRCTTCKIPKVAKMDRIQKGVSYASDQI
jgi:hypothetical protein